MYVYMSQKSVFGSMVKKKSKTRVFGKRITSHHRTRSNFKAYRCMALTVDEKSHV